MNARNASLLLVVAVIALICALWIVSHRYAPVIVIAPGCEQTASRAVWPQHYVLGQRVWRV